MTDCVVEFHLEVLGLMDLVQGALGGFYPRAVSQVDSVSVDVTDVVGLSVVSYLNDFTEAVDSEYLLSIKVTSVYEVTQLKLTNWLVCSDSVLCYHVSEFSVCLPLVHTKSVVMCGEM